MLFSGILHCCIFELDRSINIHEYSERDKTKDPLSMVGGSQGTVDRYRYGRGTVCRLVRNLLITATFEWLV
jgi:hypothetical protein